MYAHVLRPFGKFECLFIVIVQINSALTSGLRFDLGIRMISGCLCRARPCVISIAANYRTFMHSYREWQWRVRLQILFSDVIFHKGSVCDVSRGATSAASAR